MNGLINCFQGSGLYFPLGFEHILDPNGYDHILFVVALCATFELKLWRKVLILVTAFTIGHSVTLALSALDILSIDSALIETLIPITILITAVHNLFQSSSDKEQKLSVNYVLALGFGFIHGMGFSNYLKMLLGESTCIPGPLLMFNLGIEVGQVFIVLATMLIGWVVISRLGVALRWWNYVLSSLIALAAIGLILERVMG